ncbi:MAG: hypothetical protein GXO61_03495, partial [Epsilonproteobacteria bacterium]|nr:hypothetical protein [Campylobacterota bacterium]
ERPPLEDSTKDPILEKISTPSTTKPKSITPPPKKPLPKKDKPVSNPSTLETNSITTQQTKPTTQKIESKNSSNFPNRFTNNLKTPSSLSKKFNSSKLSTSFKSSLSKPKKNSITFSTDSNLSKIKSIHSKKIGPKKIVHQNSIPSSNFPPPLEIAFQQPTFKENVKTSSVQPSIKPKTPVNILSSNSTPPLSKDSFKENLTQPSNPRQTFINTISPNKKNITHHPKKASLPKEEDISPLDPKIAERVEHNKDQLSYPFPNENLTSKEIFNTSIKKIEISLENAPLLTSSQKTQSKEIKAEDKKLKGEVFKDLSIKKHSLVSPQESIQPIGQPSSKKVKKIESKALENFHKITNSHLKKKVPKSPEPLEVKEVTSSTFSSPTKTISSKEEPTTLSLNPLESSHQIDQDTSTTTFDKTPKPSPNPQPQLPPKNFVTLKMENANIHISNSLKGVNIHLISKVPLEVDSSIYEFVQEVMRDSGLDHYKVALRDKEKVITIDSRKRSSRKSEVNVKV